MSKPHPHNDYYKGTHINPAELGSGMKFYAPKGLLLSPEYPGKYIDYREQGVHGKLTP